MPHYQRKVGVTSRLMTRMVAIRAHVGNHQRMAAREGINIQIREAYGRRKGLGTPYEH